MGLPSTTISWRTFSRVMSLARLFVVAASAVAAARDRRRRVVGASYWIWTRCHVGRAGPGSCELKSYDASSPFALAARHARGASSAVLICFGKIYLHNPRTARSPPARHFKHTVGLRTPTPFPHLQLFLRRYRGHERQRPMDGFARRRRRTGRWFRFFAARSVAWLVAWRRRGVRSTQEERAP